MEKLMCFFFFFSVLENAYTNIDCIRCTLIYICLYYYYIIVTTVSTGQTLQYRAYQPAYPMSHRQFHRDFRTRILDLHRFSHSSPAHSEEQIKTPKVVLSVLQERSCRF